MANKGTINKYIVPGSGNGTYYYNDESTGAVATIAFNWEVISQDVVNCTTTIDWAYTLTVHGNNNGEFEYIKANDYGSIYENNIPGKSASWSEVIYSQPSSPAPHSKIYPGQTFTIGSGTYTFAHADDGTRTVGLIINGGINGGYKDVDGTETRVFYVNNLNFRINTSIILDAISKHAIITDVPLRFNDTENPTISYAVPKEISQVYAYISFDGVTETITSRAISATGSSYTFNFTDAERRVLWQILDQGLTTKQVWFYVRSIDAAGVVYQERLPSTLEIIDYMPTLDPEVWDSNTDVVNRLSGNKYILVRYVSNAAYTTGAQAKKHGTIETQTTKNGGNTKYGASGTFTNVTDNLFTFTATDNFGRTVSADMEFNRANGYFVDYVRLTCSVTATEMTADGDIQILISGKCFNGSFGKKTNRLRVFYDIAKNNDEDFTHVDLGYADLASNYGNSFTVDGNDYTYVLNISDLEYLSVYDFTVWVADEVATEGVSAFTVLASTPIFDWGRTDFNFNVPVNVEGDLTVSGNITAGGNTVPTIVAQGTAGIWTYRTWSDGTAECWGKKDFTVTFPSSANWGGLYTTGAISGSNILFPYGLFAETPVVNASLLVRSAGGILMAPGGAGSNIANMDQTGVYEIARGASVSGSQYYTINYQVIGKWK